MHMRKYKIHLVISVLCLLTSVLCHLSYAEEQPQQTDPAAAVNAASSAPGPASPSVIAGSPGDPAAAPPAAPSVIARSPEGATKQSLSSEDYLNQRMTLDLRDMDIIDALKFLAMKGNINIVAGKDVSGRCSLFLKNVTIKDGLDIILAANNLAYEKRGDILYIMTEAEYKILYGGNLKDKRQVLIFRLNYTKPEAVFKALDVIKSEIGKVIVDEESGSVVIMETPDKLIEMGQVIANLDRVLLTKTFTLEYARAKEIQSALAVRLDAKKTGAIVADERNNQVIITAFPERMKEAEELIKGLDKKTKQVLLEAKILKIVLKDNFDMGVNWSQILTSAAKGSVTLAGAYAFPSGQSAPVNFFKISGSNSHYSAVLQALQEFGETRNLSSPSIMVTNNQEARIYVGTTQAYVTTTIATGSTTSSTAAQVTFLDVGVQLVVTPTVNNDGFVTMKIKPEVSSVDSQLTYKIAADVDNTVPIVARTTAETSVMVKDGTTIIIGGLRKDEKLKTVDKVPLLGDIPFLGAAFRKTTEKLEKNEIVVFITPHIVYGDEAAADVGTEKIWGEPHAKGIKEAQGRW